MILVFTLGKWYNPYRRRQLPEPGDQEVRQELEQEGEGRQELHRVIRSDLRGQKRYLGDILIYIFRYVIIDGLTIFGS